MSLIIRFVTNPLPNKNPYLLGTATVFTFTDSESRKHMEFYHKLMDSKVHTSLSLQWGIVSQFIHG